LRSTAADKNCQNAADFGYSAGKFSVAAAGISVIAAVFGSISAKSPDLGGSSGCNRDFRTIGLAKFGYNAAKSTSRLTKFGCNQAAIGWWSGARFGRRALARSPAAEAAAAPQGPRSAS
jgi:hypothetical protein